MYGAEDVPLQQRTVHNDHILFKFHGRRRQDDVETGLNIRVDLYVPEHHRLIADHLNADGIFSGGDIIDKKAAVHIRGTSDRCTDEKNGGSDNYIVLVPDDPFQRSNRSRVEHIRKKSRYKEKEYHRTQE